MEVPATAANAARIVWAIYWRSTLLTTLVGFVVGFVMATTIEQQKLQAIMQSPLFLLGTVVVFLSIATGIVYRLQNKGFGRYRLALMEK